MQLLAASLVLTVTQFVPLQFTFTSLLALISMSRRTWAFEHRSFQIARVQNFSDFGTNILQGMNTSDSATEGRAVVKGKNGSIYVVGDIHAFNDGTNEQSYIDDESTDTLGDVDIFALKTTLNGTVEWGKRMGSRGKDEPKDAVSDNAGNLYITGSVGRSFVGETAGAFVTKYNSQGSRVWAKTYGSSSSKDIFTAIATNFYETELLVTGKIGPTSPLRRKNGTHDFDTLLVARINTTNGIMIETASVEPFAGSKGVEGKGILLKNTSNGSRILVTGTALHDSQTEKINNGVMYAFSYPNLEISQSVQLDTQTNDDFRRLAGSLNEHSVYAVGSTYVSIYEEFDIRVQRFNAKDLKLGWSRTIGSKRFENQASIQSGGATESGRDILIDEYGNLLVLAQASGSLTKDTEQEDLNQRRPAVLFLAANGSTGHIIQANGTEDRAVRRMAVIGDQLFVCGSILNATSSVMQAYVSSVNMGSFSKRALSTEEIVLGNSKPPLDKPGGETTEPREESESNEEDERNIALIAGVAAGGAALILIIVVVIIITRRNVTRANNIFSSPHA